MSRTQEYFITDNADALIDRKEVHAKLIRLKSYLRRVKMRLSQLDKTRDEMIDKKLQTGVMDAHLKQLKIKSKLSQKI